VRQFLAGFAGTLFSNICAFSRGNPWEFLEKKWIVPRGKRRHCWHVQDDPRNR